METQPERKRNKLATHSLALVLLSFFVMSFNGSDEPGALTILGLIGVGGAGLLGFLALKQIKKSHDKGVNLAQFSTFFGLTPVVLMISMTIMVAFRSPTSAFVTLVLIIAYFVWMFRFFRSVSKSK